MYEHLAYRNHFYYASKLISKSSFIFFYATSNRKLSYFMHINCTIFILSKYCYDLMPEANKKTAIFQLLFFVFNIQSRVSCFISVCTLIVEKCLLFYAINKKISMCKRIIVLVDKTRELSILLRTFSHIYRHIKLLNKNVLNCCYNSLWINRNRFLMKFLNIFTIISLMSKESDSPLLLAILPPLSV